MDQLIDMLHKTGCSLVVRDRQGNVTLYDKQGVRDLVWLLDNHPERLCGSSLADKVVGKAAAALMVRGKVGHVYADVMSELALPLLSEAEIPFSYGQLVSRIVIPAGDERCPLEQIVTPAATAEEAEALLRAHFAEMAARNSRSQ